MAPALSLRGICLQFGGIAALRDVDLTVQEGEIHSLIGPNGAGKSSALNVMTGIYQPDRGEISIGGTVMPRVNLQRLAGLGVARTFQNIALFKGLSVSRNIEIGLTGQTRAGLFAQIIGLRRARDESTDARAQAAEMIERFDLAAFADQPADKLPYGVQKRVELARALVAKPKLLLLDEPMAGMTGGEKAEMCNFIRLARDDWNTTVVLVEHDMAVVMSLSDRLTVLDHGVRIADGTPAQVQADPAVIEAYLGVEEAAEIRQAELAA